jgi:hypothetical protein
MASVNLTCVDCGPARPCVSCRAIAKALRTAGHVVTQTSRYDALRAATVGRYGFDACVLPLGKQERSVLDAARSLLSKTRVGIIALADSFREGDVPQGFTVIAAADWQTQPFPTEWIDGTSAVSSAVDQESDSTRLEPALQASAADIGVAKRRLKSLATRAQREL